MTTRSVLPFLLSALASAALFGCSKAESAGPLAAPLPAPDPAFIDEIKHKVEASFQGDERPPPTDLLKPMPGKNVWIISPGMAGESSSIPVNAAKEAGTLIGWKMTVFDGKLNLASFATGIRQAVAAKADGIIVDGIDCPILKEALSEAKAAKVKTVGLYSLDCDDPNLGKGSPLFDGMVSYGARGNYAQVAREFGARKADWLIYKTDGKAKLIQLKEDEFVALKYVREGFEREFGKCKSCQIVETVDFSIVEYGPKLHKKVLAALLKHPEANAVHVPYDVPMHYGVGTALVESQRNDLLHVIAGEGFDSNIELIRANKGQDAANASSPQWAAWAAVDALNAVFHGQKPRDGGMGMKLIDREHNLPPAGKGYVPTTDFRAAYTKAWGLAP